jgi:hypothetical protein
VRECRFHKDIYDASAVAGAVEVYARFAEITVSDEGEHRVVRIAAKTPARARKVGLELANYALGLTRKQGAVA